MNGGKYKSSVVYPNIYKSYQITLSLNAHIVTVKDTLLEYIGFFWENWVH